MARNRRAAFSRFLQTSAAALAEAVYKKARLFLVFPRCFLAHCFCATRAAARRTKVRGRFATAGVGTQHTRVHSRLRRGTRVPVLRGGAWLFCYSMGGGKGFSSSGEGFPLHIQREQQQQQQNVEMISSSSKTMHTEGQHHHLSFGIGGISVEYPTANTFASSGAKVSGTCLYSNAP